MKILFVGNYDDLSSGIMERLRQEENDLYFDNVNYDITVEDIQIKKEYILINIVINDKEQCLVLKGEVYEISSS